MNNKDVMIDTGADPFVVDKGTLQAMRIPYEAWEDRVYGLGRSPLVVCGNAWISIYIGNSQRMVMKWRCSTQRLGPLYWAGDF